MKRMLKSVAVSLVLILGPGLPAGAPWCQETGYAQEKRTVVTEEENDNERVYREKVEVEEEKGVLRSVFDAIGEVLALPFQLVADLFRAIF